MLTIMRGYGWAHDIQISGTGQTDLIFARVYTMHTPSQGITFGPFAVADGIAAIRLTGQDTQDLHIGVSALELLLQREDAVAIHTLDAGIDVKAAGTPADTFGDDVVPLVDDDGVPIILTQPSDQTALSLIRSDGSSGGGGSSGGSNGQSGSGGTMVTPQIDLSTAVTLPTGIDLNVLVDEITLSPPVPAGAPIGTLSVSNAAGGFGYSYALVEDAQGLFSVSGSTFELAGALDQHSGATYTITLQATPISGPVVTRTLPVEVIASTPTITLSPLTLTHTTIAADAVAGSVVGTLAGQTTGSNITLIDDAGGHFALSSGNIVRGLASPGAATPASYDIVVREALTGATNSPRDTTLSVAINAVPTGLIAYQEGEGQSLMVGFNNVNTLDTKWHKAFDNVFAFDNVNNVSNVNADVQPVQYLLVPDGQTINGVVGRQGELNISGEAGGVGPLFGLVAEYDENALFSEADALYQLKASTAGQHISAFVPESTASVFKLLTYGRRAVRNWLANQTSAVYLQAKVWAQGEANTNAPRAADNTSHPDIVGYRAELQRVYDFDAAQLGGAPLWFINKLKLRLGDSDGPYAAVTDPFTAALNTELRAFCRYTVNFNAALEFMGITDNGAGSGRNDGCYFLDHSAQAGENADPHITSNNSERIGRAVAAALRTIHGGSGWSTAHPLVEIKPVVITHTTQPAGTGSIVLDTTVSDDGTLYAAAVPATDPAPDTAQIVAGTGGGIVGTGSATLNGSPQSDAAASLSATITGLSPGTDYDVHFVFVERDQSTESVVGSALGLTTDGVSNPGGGSPASTWNPTFETSEVAYSDNDRTATRTVGNATDHVRGQTPITSGKRYFELHHAGSGNTARGGIGAIDSPAGGTRIDGVTFCGWQFSNVIYSGGQQSGGVALNNNYKLLVALDAATQTFWIRLDDASSGLSPWNGDASADPALGIGGLSYADLRTDPVPIASLHGVGSTLQLRVLSTEWSHTAPSGFTELP